MQIYDNLLEAPSNFATFFCVSSLSARPSQPLFSSPVFVYLSNYQYFSLKNHATPPFAVFPDSRWDRYLGMTAAMTQVPMAISSKIALAVCTAGIALFGVVSCIYEWIAAAGL